MNNKTRHLPVTTSSIFVKIIICIAFINIVSSHLPNGIDGIYLNDKTYVHGINDIITFIALIPVFGLCLFTKELVAKCKKCFAKGQLDTVINISRIKVYVCVAMCIVFLLMGISCIGYVTVNDDSLSFKKGMFFQEKVVAYTELQDCDLFVAIDNEVYWGKTTEERPDGRSEYFDYDIYLGKLENNDRLINQIREKSGRTLELST